MLFKFYDFFFEHWWNVLPAYAGILLMLGGILVTIPDPDFGHLVIIVGRAIFILFTMLTIIRYILGPNILNVFELINDNAGILAILSLIAIVITVIFYIINIQMPARIMTVISIILLIISFINIKRK